MRFLVAFVAICLGSSIQSAEKPNIILILADDLGYGDLGCYGQPKIQTPVLDQLAKDGMKFTHAYAGSTVCAPSRCTLMTGLHTGHCLVRGNGGGAVPKGNVPLRPDEFTIAKALKDVGYSTALIGKWGLGEVGSTGIPNKQGFDYFFGYLNQTHAHNYYPDFLWRNTTKVSLPNEQSENEGVSQTQNVYTPDLFRDEALKYIESNKDAPFFLFYSTTVPHANNERTRFDSDGNEVPDLGLYADKDWPIQEKKKAAMITRLDTDVGVILDKVKALGLEKNTLILFSSDNGPHKEGGNDPNFFNSSGPLRGIKRDLSDGGIRVPAIARWTGTIEPGQVSDHVWAFWDIPPTFAELAGATITTPIDGISFVPTLTGHGKQKEHEWLYWEFHERGFKQAVRHGPWKAIRIGWGNPLELYNVVDDPDESDNLAKQKPELVAKIEDYLKTARTESQKFPIEK